jgi:uncharacterized protein YbaR (Trm112 family)
VHLLLTDRLICPRCGPGFGLVLRADRLEDRRVERGGLGCPNCREVYPVIDGVADLRPPPRPELPPAPSVPVPEADELLRVQALLGIAVGPGEVLLLGRAARFAPGLARRVPGLELLAGGPVPDEPPSAETSGVSRLRLGEATPFDSRALRGVVTEGEASRPRLREAARIVAPGGRVVVMEAPAGTAEILMASGLTVRLDESGVVVAGR